MLRMAQADSRPLRGLTFSIHLLDSPCRDVRGRRRSGACHRLPSAGGHFGYDRRDVRVVYTRVGIERVLSTRGDLSKPDQKQLFRFSSAENQALSGFFLR